MTSRIVQNGVKSHKIGICKKIFDRIALFCGLSTSKKSIENCEKSYTFNIQRTASRCINVRVESSHRHSKRLIFKHPLAFIEAKRRKI